MNQNQIPFNRPCLEGNEIAYIAQVIASGRISGDGIFTKECQTLLERELGVSRALLTTSCTHALEMTALLLEIEPGDQVIIPSFTFVSTANAFVMHGATPIFADIRPDTLNLDETQLEQLITPRTKAIVPVHYAGVGCEMEKILEIAHRYDVAVIEDSAHGLFGKYKEKGLGTFGCLATLSFHETKNFTCGEGGALLINDPQFIERAEIIREKGTDRSKFFRGEVDKYTWIDLGSSYPLSEILAAFLYGQLEARAQVEAKRRRIWECYDENLQDWARDHDVRLPLVPPYCEQPYHLFYVLMPTPTQRQALIAYLKAHNIHAVFHYLPLHLSRMGRRFGGKIGDCPVSEDVSERLIRLPFYNELSEADQAYIIDSICQFERG